MNRKKAKSLVDQDGAYGDIVEKALSDKRVVQITGMVTAGLYHEISARLRFLASLNDKPITIYLNTPGGMIDSGLGLYDLIREIDKTVPITIIAQAQCMSMGVIILQAARKRLSYPHTFFLLHELRATGDPSTTTLSQMQDDIQYSKALQKILDEILSKRTGQSVAALKKLYLRKDYFLDPKEALRLNLIDGILPE